MRRRCAGGFGLAGHAGHALQGRGAAAPARAFPAAMGFFFAANVEMSRYVTMRESLEGGINPLRALRDVVNAACEAGGAAKFLSSATFVR